MNQNKKIAIVAKFVSFKEAEENDNLYFSKMSAEDLLKECFDLRRLNYFDGKENNLPRIEMVGRIIKQRDNEKQNA